MSLYGWMMNQQLFPVFARSKRTNLGPDYPLYRARYEHIPPSVRCHPERPRDFTKRSDGLRTARPPGRHGLPVGRPQLHRSKSWTARHRSTNRSYAFVAESASPRPTALSPADTRPGESSAESASSESNDTNPP